MSYLTPAVVLVLLASWTAPSFANDTDREKKPSPTRQDVGIAGWTLEVDSELLEGPHQPVGTQALTLLRGDLERIAFLLPAERVAELQKIRIVLDREHPGLTAMQYHPSAGWLRENGYDPGMAKKVHIPKAAGYANPRHYFVQPWATLHELAHAYHDQILSFENPKVIAAFENAKAAGLYEKVRHIDGREIRHYALTNHKEYFAESTEAFFGTNDFYPYVRSELRIYDPVGFAMLEEVWGAKGALPVK